MKSKECRTTAILLPLKDYVYPNDTIGPNEMMISGSVGDRPLGWVEVGVDFGWLRILFNEFELGDKVEIIVRKVE